MVETVVSHCRSKKQIPAVFSTEKYPFTVHQLNVGQAKIRALFVSARSKNSVFGRTKNRDVSSLQYLISLEMIGRPKSYVIVGHTNVMGWSAPFI